MKRMLSAALLVLAAALTAQAQPRQLPLQNKPTARQLAAIAEMEKAQDAADVDDLAQAELHARRAAELDPANKETLLFIAQVISQQYNRMPDGAEKTARMREALQAYQRVVAADPLDDEAFNAVGVIYGELHEDELRYAWVMQRTLAPFPDEKRAEAYLTLEWLDRDCAAAVVSGAFEQLYDQEAGRFQPERLTDEIKLRLAQGQQCVARGLQMAEQSLALRPEDDTAWQGKIELLMNASQLAVLLGDEAEGERYLQESSEAGAHSDALKLKRRQEVEGSSPRR